MARTLAALCLLAMAASASAGRTLEIIEHSTEAALTDLTLPSGPTGTVIVNRHCDGCQPRVLLAGTDTVYLVGDTRVMHADFAREIASARADGEGASSLVGIYYLPDSSRVTRIALHRHDRGDR